MGHLDHLREKLWRDAGHLKQSNRKAAGAVCRLLEMGRKRAKSATPAAKLETISVAIGPKCQIGYSRGDGQPRCIPAAKIP